MSPILSLPLLPLFFLSTLLLATSFTSGSTAGLAELRQRDALTVANSYESLYLLLENRDAGASSPSMSSPSPKTPSGSGAGTGSRGTQSGGKSGGKSGGTGGMMRDCPCNEGGIPQTSIKSGMSLSPIPMLKKRGLYSDAEQGHLGIRSSSLFGLPNQNCRPVACA